MNNNNYNDYDDNIPLSMVHRRFAQLYLNKSQHFWNDGYIPNGTLKHTVPLTQSDCFPSVIELLLEVIVVTWVNHRDTAKIELLVSREFQTSWNQFSLLYM